MTNTQDTLNKIHLQLYNIRESTTDTQLKGLLHHAMRYTHMAITSQRHLDKLNEN